MNLVLNGIMKLFLDIIMWKNVVFWMISVLLNQVFFDLIMIMSFSQNLFLLIPGHLEAQCFEFILTRKILIDSALLCKLESLLSAMLHPDGGDLRHSFILMYRQYLSSEDFMNSIILRFCFGAFSANFCQSGLCFFVGLFFIFVDCCFCLWFVSLFV